MLSATFCVSALGLGIPIWKMGMGISVWSASWEYGLARGGGGGEGALSPLSAIHTPASPHCEVSLWIQTRMLMGSEKVRDKSWLS